MTALKKKIFSNKQYQFGYNDAMDIALEKELELEARIKKLTIENENINTNLTKEALRLVDVCNKRQEEIDELTCAILKWLDGDYPNPRQNRPHNCVHGVGYWESCDNCETEYWESTLASKQEDE